MHNVEFHNGLDILDVLRRYPLKIIIVDDFMTETAEYFTRFSHHGAQVDLLFNPKFIS